MTATLIIRNGLCAALNFGMFVFSDAGKRINFGMGLFNSAVVVALVVLP